MRRLTREGVASLTEEEKNLLLDYFSAQRQVVMYRRMAVAGGALGVLMVGFFLLGSLLVDSVTGIFDTAFSLQQGAMVVALVAFGFFTLYRVKFAKAQESEVTRLKTIFSDKKMDISDLQENDVFVHMHSA